MNPALASKTTDKLRRYNPHGTGRMEELAGVPLASFGSRALAFGIDFLFVLIFFVPTMLLVEWLRAGRGPLGNVHLEFDFHHLSSVIFTVLYFGTTLYIGNGRTLGKRIAGIRVVSLIHERLTLWQSIERALGYGASMLEGGFGFLQYFTHPNRSCVHDRIAETIVIREKPAS